MVGDCVRGWFTFLHCCACCENNVTTRLNDILESGLGNIPCVGTLVYNRSTICGVLLVS